MEVRACAVRTERLSLRPPVYTDVELIFSRYAADPIVGRLLSWPLHRNLDDTRDFVRFSREQWRRDQLGPLLIFRRATGALLGSTGLALETVHTASTGYVLARDCWGLGYATESLSAILDIASARALRTIVALCHRDNAASSRVLTKRGFQRNPSAKRCAAFPNLPGAPTLPVDQYVLSLLSPD